MSKRVQFWLGIGISLVCLVVILWLVDLEALAAALKAADWRVVLIISLGQLGFMFLRAVRWRLMLTLSAGQARYWPLFHAQNIGYLITNLLPFRLGDLARAYLAGQEPGLSGIQALSSVVLERVLDMLVILVLFGITVPLAPALPGEMKTAGIVVSGAAVAGFLVMLLAVAYRPRTMTWADRVLVQIGRLDRESWLRRVESLLDGFAILTRWRRLLQVLGLSGLLWLFIVSGYYWGLRGFWPQATLVAALFALSAAAFGVTLPSSPGFVGVFQGAVMIGLSVFPATREQALSFAVAYHATTYLVVIALGLIGLWQSGQSLGNVMAAARRWGKS